ncbi:CHAT domain-containing protein [Bradyrhizobium yuanmingense]|uniref:CHAT domain-containing protein n=1 Tax=Bradyrhizobium yuanmingense TaxID=108015 RepID=UPI0021A51869|nr:CHAT domain-containing protein [Bradyrhizobium sp. CB1024]UWU84919.1 CHAT domain-containing protein [Bradyrhizobium sp. CB1024]
MDQLLGRIDSAGAIQFVWRPHTIVEDLSELITSEAPDVLHVAAHLSQGELILANEHDKDVPLSGTKLNEILEANGHHFKLIVLNGCASADAAVHLKKVSDFVIATTEIIKNRASIVATATLYSHLARGHTVARAYESARAMSRAIQLEKLDFVLLAAEGQNPATTRLAEPFRIVACIPKIDKRIRKGARPYSEKEIADVGSFNVDFGVAGAPATTRQLVFFTDDEDIAQCAEAEAKGEYPDYEEWLSWIVRTSPTHGEIWIDYPLPYKGDLRWFATITTVDGRAFVTNSLLGDALHRYYIDEEWEGPLSPEWKTAVISCINLLRSTIGAKRVKKLK